MKKIKNRNQKLAVGIVIVVIVLLIGMIFFVHPEKKSADSSKEDGESADSVENTMQATEIDKTESAFPYQLDEGKLEIESLFPFSGINPDCGNEECENAAAIQLTNQSGKYLSEAQITMTFDDKSELTFEVQDVPDGGVIYAFDTQNRAYSDSEDRKVTDVTAETTYADSSSLLGETISADVSDTTITLTNHSQESFDNLTVTYHCVMENTLFGGISYKVTADALGAGETAEVQAEEAWLGAAKVTKVTGN